MKKSLINIFPALVSALFIFGVAFADDRQLNSCYVDPNISETVDFKTIEGKDASIAVSIHHTGSTDHSGNYSLSLDLGRLKREAEREVFCENAYENPSSPDTVTIFKMVFNELSYFEGLKKLFDRVETKAKYYQRKYKLKGDVDLAEPNHTKSFDSISQFSENTHRSTSESRSFFSNLLPDRISWNISTDLGSNYLKGKVELGNHFVIKGNWGSESDVAAMVVIPF